jgi:hypothetical protein
VIIGGLGANDGDIIVLRKINILKYENNEFPFLFLLLKKWNIGSGFPFKINKLLSLFMDRKASSPQSLP